MNNIDRRGFLSFLGFTAAVVVAKQTEERDLLPAEAKKVERQQHEQAVVYPKDSF